MADAALLSFLAPNLESLGVDASEFRDYLVSVLAPGDRSSTELSDADARAERVQLAVECLRGAQTGDAAPGALDVFAEDLAAIVERLDEDRVAELIGAEITDADVV